MGAMSGRNSPNRRTGVGIFVTSRDMSSIPAESIELKSKTTITFRDSHISHSADDLSVVYCLTAKEAVIANGNLNPRREGMSTGVNNLFEIAQRFIRGSTDSYSRCWV
jgi:hypothetical protein